MIKTSTLLIFIILNLFFIGCSTKQYDKSEPRLITLKMGELRFSDMGFVRTTNEMIEIELFEAGNAVMSMSINHLICINNEGCMSKSTFNEKYLNSFYPEDLLQNIFLAKPIFEAIDITDCRGGFEQHIKTENFDIVYKTCDNQIYFKDRYNNILIKVGQTR